MDPTLVKLSCNWVQIGGCQFSQAVQLQNADPDVFKRPSLDELVDEDKAILLSKGESTDNCELIVKLYPHYKIQAFSLVCNANKVEIFQGYVKEYLETIYGSIVDDCEDEQFKTYRYDVEVEKSGITELIIKFPSQSTEICLFGIALQTAPNPNGITTLLPHSGAINIENVKSMLKSSSKPLTPGSEKCKQLLEFMEKTKTLPPHISATNANASLTDVSLQQLMLQHCNINQPQNMDVYLQGTKENIACSKTDAFETSIKKYIDERFLELEGHLNQRLLQMEQLHIEKFDCVIKLLEKLGGK